MVKILDTDRDGLIDASTGFDPNGKAVVVENTPESD